MKQLLFTLFLLTGTLCVAQDASFSKVYVVGNTYESIQLTSAVTLDNGLITISTPVANGIDGVILRSNPDGTVRWQQNYFGPFSLGGLFFSDIIATHDSCFLVSGLVGNSSTSDYFPFCMKVSDLGDILWTKTFDFDTPPLGLFGYQFDRYSRVCETQDSSLLMVWKHESYDSSSSSPTPDQLCVSKLSSNGSVLWTSSILSDSTFYAADIVEGEDQSIYVAGNTKETSGSGYLINLSDSGDFNWGKKYDGVNFDEIILDSTGCALSYWNMSQQTSGIMKLDTLGVNTKRVEFTGWLSEVRPSFDRRDNGNYIFSQSGDNFGGGLLFEIDEDLNLFSSYAALMILQTVRSIPNYGIYAVGYGPMYGLKTPYNEVGVLRYDSLLNTSLLCSWPDNYNMSNDSTILDQSVFFTPGDSVIEIQEPITSSSSFTSVMNDCVTFIGSVDEIEGTWNESISPNPSTGEFTISWNEYRDAELVIFNSVGKEIYRKSAKNSFVEFDLKAEQSGMYYYRLTDEEGSQSNGKLTLMK